MQQSIWQGIKLVFRKELVVGLRFKAAWAAMRIYGRSQAVLMGKMRYTFFLMVVLATFITPLFVLLLDVTVTVPGLLGEFCCWAVAALPLQVHWWQR